MGVNERVRCTTERVWTYKSASLTPYYTQATLARVIMVNISDLCEHPGNVRFSVESVDTPNPNASPTESTSEVLQPMSVGQVSMSGD